ncbi:MAG: hypothetical protein BZY80_06340 [SAR202 cluster bacterium Io17-Chloro-G2]|nr:MAG: hypothetical protein BZY80_06340 [SAR202 cluster bacterium Io17-Chloro-G2]
MALTSQPKPWFKGLCWLSVLTVGALVVLGGVVRVTGSGLGCPDWPLCHGGIFPPLELQPVIEYSHRLVASALVGPLVLATCIAAWMTHRRDRWIVVPATVAVVLLIGQALLGGVTVLTELPGGIVAAHLALAQALLGTLILLLVVSHRGPFIWGRTTDEIDETGGIEGAGKFPKSMLAAAVAVYALILTGSFVTAAGATAACTTWPLCQGNVFPQSTLQAIHMGHRLATLGFGLFVLYSLHLGIRGKDRPKGVRFLAMAASTIFALQVAAGAATVWLDFAIWLRALHLSLATALWGFVAGLAVLVHATSPFQYPERSRDLSHD